jgi:pyrroline-5-carboxylate reductase
MISLENLSFSSFTLYTTKIKMVSTTATVSTDSPIISFIGGGNMAEAILGGLYSQGHPHTKLRFSEPLKERMDYMKNKYPQVIATEDNATCVEGADIVILAVKPQVLKTVVTDLASSLHKNPDILIISIAAGIESEAILRWLNADYQAPLVRIMPNTPALIGEGAVGLFANPVVTKDQKDLTERLLGSVSKQLSWVENESLIDAITGVSGSGPAYFFLIMEAMGK